MLTESGFASKIFPAKEKQKLPLQFGSGDRGFSPGGTASFLSLMPRHNTLYCTPMTDQYNSREFFVCFIPSFDKC